MAQSAAQPTEYPVYYFFYGTLAIPSQLMAILDLAETPELRPAHIFGYAMGRWSCYRTLLPGTKEDMISGYAYLVTSAEHAARLARYETGAYKVDSCRIFFADNAPPPQVEGKTFVYAGDPDALREGRPDQKLRDSQISAAQRG
jgi:hypothetical protein